MKFALRLTLSGIILTLFTLIFAYYQSKHPWPSPLEMYPCFAVVGLLGLFLYSTPRSSH